MNGQLTTLLEALATNRGGIERALAAAERDLVTLRDRSASLEETARLARLMLMSLEVGRGMVAIRPPSVGPCGS